MTHNKAYHDMGKYHWDAGAVEIAKDILVGCTWCRFVVRVVVGQAANVSTYSQSAECLTIHRTCCITPHMTPHAETYIILPGLLVYLRISDMSMVMPPEMTAGCAGL
jgi:hypothetical protein